MWTAQAHSSDGVLTPKKGIEHTVSAQRARLDLNDRSARWREPYKRPMWTATWQEHSGGGGGLTPKKGIEHRERTTSASRLE